MRAPLPTTDALFAQEVEQKMSNLLAGFGAVQSFLDRTKHRTATQPAAVKLLPAHRSSNLTCLGGRIRNSMCRKLIAWGAAPNVGETATAVRKQSSLTEKIILPWDRSRLRRGA